MTTDPYYDRLMAAQAEPIPPQVLAIAMERLAVHSTPDPGYVSPQVDVIAAAAPGPHGPVPVRVYLPRESTRTRPLFVWCHGGGWVEGDLDMPEADATAREVCARGGAVVVSVDYRLATAGVHYPVPVDDVLAAWRWSLDHAADWGSTADRAVLGGASAGGNIAAGAAMRLRDENGPAPKALVLVYPALHADLPALTQEQRDHRGITSEVEQHLRMRLRLMLENYTGGSAAEAPPYVVPGEGDPSGLPATLIVTCEYDILRTSGEAFARSLDAAGVPNKLVMAAGVGHAHINTPWLTAAQESYADIAAWVSHA